MKPPHHESKEGVLYAAGAFVIWGLFPIYWRLLSHVSPWEIVLHRILWCGVFMAAFLAVKDRLKGTFAALRNPRSLAILTVTALLITVNWTLFIWTVSSNQLVEASLGYYINPLLSIALGVVLLGEKLTPLRLAGVALAAAAVLVQTFTLGHFPWIALVLAASFATYGYLRKTAPVNSLDGLAVETIVLFLPVAAVVGFWAVRGEGSFLHADFPTDLLLILGGPATALPLALFAAGARRIRLSTLGFLQYVSPSTTLVLATVFYGEPFTWLHAATFGCVWLALLLVSFEGLLKSRTQAEPV